MRKEFKTWPIPTGLQITDQSPPAVTDLYGLCEFQGFHGNVAEDCVVLR